MKKTLLSIFTLATCTLAANAQLVLDSTALPVQNTLYLSNIYDGNLAILDAGTPGDNKTWNFADLTSSLENDTSAYFDPAEDEFDGFFLESNLASFSSDGAEFYKVTGSEVSLLGFASEETGLLEFDEPATYYKFPLALGSANRSTGKFVMTLPSNTLPTIDSTRRTTTIIVDYKVDASGELITPEGSFDALRVAQKSIIKTTVEFHLKGGTWQLSATQPAPTFFSAYSWETNETGEAALTFNYSDSTWTALDEVSWNAGSNEIILNKRETEAESAFTLYPNPASDKFMLTGNSEVSSVAIYNTSGTEVMNISGIGISDAVSVADLEAGMYNVKIVNNKGVNWKKLVVSK